ncbi:MAG: hypothetical protein MHMPM18_004654 [Marteilia pararefringens]
MYMSYYQNKIMDLFQSTDYCPLGVNDRSLQDLIFRAIKIINSLQPQIKLWSLKFKLKNILSTTLNQINRGGLFYGLPKIHKHPTNPPIKPVVYQINQPTAPIARLIDKKVQPALFANNPHLLSSTPHVMDTINGWTPNGTKLVSLDVKSL